MPIETLIPQGAPVVSDTEIIEEQSVSSNEIRSVIPDFTSLSVEDSINNVLATTNAQTKEQSQNVFIDPSMVHNIPVQPDISNPQITTSAFETPFEEITNIPYHGAQSDGIPSLSDSLISSIPTEIPQIEEPANTQEISPSTMMNAPVSEIQTDSIDLPPVYVESTPPMPEVEPVPFFNIPNQVVVPQTYEEIQPSVQVEIPLIPNMEQDDLEEQSNDYVHSPFPQSFLSEEEQQTTEHKFIISDQVQVEPGYKICPKCGQKMREDYRLCFVCGTYF